MPDITNYLNSAGFTTPSEECYENIKTWLSWYCGKVSSFHTYSQYNGKTNVRRSRASLGMAKYVCEDWANLLMNEHVAIGVSQKKADAFLKNVLNRNNFGVRANRLIELCFATGTGAFVEYLSQGEIKIDYVRADMIFPLSWENGEIKECAFASRKIIGGKECVYLNMHIKNGETYAVINKLFEIVGNGLAEISLPSGIAARVDTGSKNPLFQIIMPNIVNSTDLDSPMGISVFAGAIDILKGIDLVYDSYQNEFRLGKKRILVPASMAQIQNGANGIMPVFDDNDTEFYAMADRSLGELKEIDMSLRAQPHELALQRNLDLLSQRCGLGCGRYNYQSGSAPKTATEVISEKSDLYVNICKNELVLKHALEEMAKGILHLGGFKPGNVVVHFDDSVIEDSTVNAERALEEFKNGIITKEEYLLRVYGDSTANAGKGETT